MRSVTRKTDKVEHNQVPAAHIHQSAHPQQHNPPPARTSVIPLRDNRPETRTQQALQGVMNTDSQVKQLGRVQRMADTSPQSQHAAALQRKMNQPHGSSMHSPSQLIQAKRARPGPGSNRKKYDKLAPVYEVDKAKGAKYLATLEKRIADVNLDEGLPAHIYEKNYNEDARIYYAFKTTMSDDVDDGRGIYEVNSVNPKDKTNYYHNNYILPNGIVLADNNQEGNNPSPPPNSQMIWYQYSMAKAHYDKTYGKKTKKEASPIRAICRETIKNDETNAVIWMVYDNDGQASKTVTATSNDGKALLGTPNGKSSIWMLHDHYEEMGNITGIDTVKIYKGEEGQDMEIKYKT